MNYFNTIYNIPIYIDSSVEENTFLKGRKQDTHNSFIIANEKTANLIYRILLIKERKEKLNKIANSETTEVTDWITERILKKKII